jgi:alpha-tubulin suppressor-like RCC1 family protein
MRRVLADLGPTLSGALGVCVLSIACGGPSGTDDGGGARFEPVAYARANYTCLRDEDGDVSCLGDSDVLPVENPDAFEQWDVDYGWNCTLAAQPVPELSGVSALWTRARCAVGGSSDGRVWCWGTQYNDAPPIDVDLAEYGFPESRVPVERADLVGLDALIELADGRCGIDSDGALKCVGVNRFGVFGSENLEDWRPLKSIGGLPPVVSVDGYLHLCAVDEAGQVWCWGIDSLDRLGLPGDVVRQSTMSGVPFVPEPTQVPGIPAAQAVRTGSLGTCVLDRDGGIWCWGGDYGPEKQKLGVPPAKELGRECMISMDDELWCWSPLQPDGWRRLEGYRVRDLTGTSHVCVIDLETELPLCDGDNTYGQLGCGKIADCPPDAEDPCQGDLPLPD